MENLISSIKPYLIKKVTSKAPLGPHQQALAPWLKPHCVGVFCQINTTYCGCQEKSEKKLSADSSHEINRVFSLETIENPPVFRTIRTFSRGFPMIRIATP